MRFRDFFIRTGIFLPMVVWSLLLALMLFGITADLFGAGPLFYCTTYCKVCLGVLILGVAALVICQALACWKDK